MNPLSLRWADPLVCVAIAHGGAMRRRAFITGLATVVTVTAWPFVANSQQATLPVVGWLNIGPSADPQFASFAKAFQAALKDAGYVDGQNIQIDFRWGEGQYARLPSLATELVARGVARNDDQ